MARGYGEGSYAPFDNVLNVQVVAFVARAMVAKRYWQQQGDNPGYYPNVPAESGHREDLATYVRYAGAIPDFPETGDFNYWDVPSAREYFTRVLWQALDSYFRVDRVP